MSNISILRSQVGTQAKVDIINNDPMGDFYRSVGTTAQQIGDNINKMQKIGMDLMGAGGASGGGQL